MSQPVPRSGETLDHLKVFDKGVVESRLRELTTTWIQHFLKEDLDNFAMEYKRQFKAVPLYPWNDAQIIEKFGEKARTEALAILEQERKNLVDYQTEYIKGYIERAIKKLRFLAYSVDEEMRPFKRRIIHDKVPVEGNFFAGNPSMRDVFYFADCEFEMYESFIRAKDSLEQFRDYVPYFGSELTELWKEARELGDLEVIDKEEIKETPKKSAKAKS